VSNNRKKAAQLMSEAGQAILKTRPGVHGDAENSFEMIGDLWTVYLRHILRVRGGEIVIIKGHDVAQMLSLMKKARATYGDTKNDDNFIDDIGYSALAGMLQLPDPDEEQATQKVETAVESAIKEIGNGNKRPV
jgi:hypothetical protein